MLVLPHGGDFPHAEERRLFYVAVTRARKRAYLVTDATRMSVFVREVCTPPYIGLVDGELAARSHLACSACEAGLIVRVEGEHGPFWGCSLYPYCTNRPHTCYTCAAAPLLPHEAHFYCMNPECAARFERCPACGTGILRARTGRFGPFLGCSNYRSQGPSCGFTRRLPDDGPQPPDDPPSAVAPPQ
jgi:DNA helicase IV